MDVNILTNINNNLIEISSLAIATLSFIISFVTLNRDKEKRQYEMLHNTFVLIGNINQKVIDCMALKIQNSKQITALNSEYLNQYSYLAFLINKKQIKDRLAYNMGHKFILQMIEDYKKMGIINWEDHKELLILEKRWKEYPPINFKNRITPIILDFLKR